MTSHDAMIQTMSHLSAFIKATAKLLLFFELTKFFLPFLVYVQIFY